MFFLRRERESFFIGKEINLHNRERKERGERDVTEKERKDERCNERLLRPEGGGGAAKEGEGARRGEGEGREIEERKRESATVLSLSISAFSVFSLSLPLSLS